MPPTIPGPLVLGREGVIFEAKRDDGELGAGLVILRVMQRQNVCNGIICVTRWFGGIKLMGDRFKHIQDAATLAASNLDSELSDC